MTRRDIHIFFRCQVGPFHLTQHDPFDFLPQQLAKAPRCLQNKIQRLYPSIHDYGYFSLRYIFCFTFYFHIPFRLGCFCLHITETKLELTETETGLHNTIFVMIHGIHGQKCDRDNLKWGFKHAKDSSLSPLHSCLHNFFTIFFFFRMTSLCIMRRKCMAAR